MKSGKLTRRVAKCPFVCLPASPSFYVILSCSLTLTFATTHQCFLPFSAHSTFFFFHALSLLSDPSIFSNTPSIHLFSSFCELSRLSDPSVLFSNPANSLSILCFFNLPEAHAQCPPHSLAHKIVYMHIFTFPPLRGRRRSVYDSSYHIFNCLISLFYSLGLLLCPSLIFSDSFTASPATSNCLVPSHPCIYTSLSHYSLFFSLSLTLSFPCFLTSLSLSNRLFSPLSNCFYANLACLTLNWSLPVCPLNSLVHFCFSDPVPCQLSDQ